MLEEYQIIRRPMITEKGSTLKDDNNQLVFEVHLHANKSEIKKAVEKLFKVTVLSVRTQNRLGKRKRLGTHGRPTQELEESDRDSERRRSSGLL